MSGYIRIAAAVPRLETANINFNVQQIISLYREAAEKKAAVVLFPELSVTGSSCGDLFFDKLLLRRSRSALQQLAEATSGCSTILAVGLPWQEKSRVLNVTAVCQNGEIRGFTAKGQL
ncbi:MAG: hypothetical protein IKC65_08495 [Lentisphaeria bacterium]|nr:hypothetical protein [Lentisphaeria bacterium]